MSQNQSAKAFDGAASKPKDEKPVLGGIYRIVDAAAVEAALPQDHPMRGNLREGYLVVALEKRFASLLGGQPEATTFAVLDEIKNTGHRPALYIPTYQEFTTDAVPGTLEHILPLHAYNSLKDYEFRGGYKDLLNIKAEDDKYSVGSVSIVEDAESANKNVYRSPMGGHLKKGDVLLLTGVGHAHLKYTVLNNGFFGWEEKRDARFLATEMWPQLTLVSADEFDTLMKGGFARHKDYGRENDFGTASQEASLGYLGAVEEILARLGPAQP